MTALVMCFQHFEEHDLKGPFAAVPVAVSAGRVIPLGMTNEVRATAGAVSNPMELDVFCRYLATLSITDKARKFINQQLTEKNMKKSAQAVKPSKITKPVGPAKVAAKPTTKVAAKPTTKVAAKPEGVSKKPGIGAYILEQIKKGASNEDILAATRDKFPGCNTTKSSVYFYRNKAKNAG